MSSVTIRPATPTDLPRMAALLIQAFSPGPWGRHLFPPELRVQPGGADELAFRLRQLTSRFHQPGSQHVCAVSVVGNSGAGGKFKMNEMGEGEEEEGDEGEVVVGWAQWIDGAGGQKGLNEDGAEDRKEKEKETAHDPGLDRAALDMLAREGDAVERRLEAYLGEEGTTNTRRELFLSSPTPKLPCS